MIEVTDREKAFFDRVYLAHYGRICKYIYHLYPSYQNCEDIAQEVFYQFLRAIKTLQNHPNITGWLYITARYCTFQHLYREKRANTARSELESSADNYDSYEEIILWESLMEYISETDAELFSDFYIYGYTAKELTEKYQKSPDTIKRKALRIKTSLKNIWMTWFTLLS